jgi:hypothetical protein
VTAVSGYRPRPSPATVRLRDVIEERVIFGNSPRDLETPFIPCANAYAMEPLFMRFTAANAREMAARSIATRKAAEARRTASPTPIPLPAIPPADADPGVNVACVRARLATLDGMMAKAKTDREGDNLTRAFDRLFRVWCVLSNTRGPGHRRPGPPARQPREIVIEPSLPWDVTPAGQAD